MLTLENRLTLMHPLSRGEEFDGGYHQLHPVLESENLDKAVIYVGKAITLKESAVFVESLVECTNIENHWHLIG